MLVEGIEMVDNDIKEKETSKAHIQHQINQNQSQNGMSRLTSIKENWDKESESKNDQPKKNSMITLPKV